MLHRLKAVLVARRELISVAAGILTILVFLVWPKGQPPAPSLSPLLPPNTVEIDGHRITAESGAIVEYDVLSTRTGGLLSEQRERRSTGTGAGLHTYTEGGAVGFTGGTAPGSTLGPDDTAGAIGGSSGSLKQTFAGGLNLCQFAAIACVGFAGYFITRKPPNKVAALHCLVSAGGLWYAGQHPWILIVVFILGLAVLAWKAHLLGGATGALDSLMFAAKKLNIVPQLHAEADAVAEAAEKPFIAASKHREGA